MLYIISPYTHPEQSLRRARAYCATKLTGELMLRIHHDWLFSPIAQGHPVAAHLPDAAASSHEFWMRQCRRALAEASAAYLLPLPGWEESKGVTEELDYCAGKALRVTYLNCRAWAMQHLRANKLNYRSPAEQEALKIWMALASGPNVRQAPKWRWNWQVEDLDKLATKDWSTGGV